MSFEEQIIHFNQEIIRLLEQMDSYEQTWKIMRLETWLTLIIKLGCLGFSIAFACIFCLESGGVNLLLSVLGMVGYEFTSHELSIIQGAWDAIEIDAEKTLNAIISCIEKKENLEEVWQKEEESVVMPNQEDQMVIDHLMDNDSLLELYTLRKMALLFQDTLSSQETAPLQESSNVKTKKR